MALALAGMTAAMVGAAAVPQDKKPYSLSVNSNLGTFWKEHPDMQALRDEHNRTGPHHPLLLVPGTVSAFTPQAPVLQSKEVVPLPPSVVASHPSLTSTTQPVLRLTVPEVDHLFHHEPMRPPPPPSWWADVKWNMREHPFSLIESALRGVYEAVKWVAMDYIDFVDGWKSWDGSWRSLLTNTHLLWRTMLTVGLTAAILYGAPFMKTLFDLLGSFTHFLFELLEGLGHMASLVVEAVEDVVSWVTRTIHY